MCVLQRSWGKCVNYDSFFLHNILWCRQQAVHNKIPLYTDWCKMSPYVESYKHVGNVCVFRYSILRFGAISSGAYIQKRRNIRAFLIDFNIRGHLNIIKESAERVQKV